MNSEAPTLWTQCSILQGWW